MTHENCIGGLRINVLRLLLSVKTLPHSAIEVAVVVVVCWLVWYLALVVL